MIFVRAAWSLLLLLSPAALHAATWHVAPGGDDAGDGGEQSPFRRIARALEAAQPGDTVLLRDGTYRETIQPARDGRPDAPITLAAAPGARPVISALEPVTGPWIRGEDGIYSTAAPAAPSLAKTAPRVAPAASTGLDQIFVNGLAQPEARFPNRSGQDPLDHEGIDVHVGANFTVYAAELARLPAQALAGARFHGLIHPAWTAQSGVVASSEGDAARLDDTTLSTPWWPNRARPTDVADADADLRFRSKSGGAPGKGYFYGTPSLLDADGEWIIERHASGDILRLRPPAGGTPDSLQVERKVRPWVIDLDRRSHWIIRDLTLNGGAVRLRGDHLVLEGCELSHPTHFLSFAEGFGYNGGLPQGAAVLLDGKNSIVRACLIRASAGSGVRLAGEGHLVSRNQLLDIDYSGTYAAGISISGNRHIVEFNTLRDTGRDCIALSGGGHRVLYNIFQRPGRLAMDGGGLYTYGQNGADPADGRSTEIAYNWAYESGNPDDPKCRGIYLDNYSRNFVVHHNVIRDLGHPGTNKGLHAGAPSVGIAFYHNTLIGVLPPTNSTFTKFPLTNREPAFWTAANNQLSYVYQNNLYVPHFVAPDAVFEEPGVGDYRPRAGIAAVDPAPSEKVKKWSTSDGKTGVPAGYVLYVQDKSVPFHFTETSGHGVRVPGINDDFTGRSPDSGAYERGRPLWRPGHAGYPAALRRSP